MTNEELLLDLQEKYPYLYDILQKVETLQRDPGFGEVSTVVHVLKGRVTTTDFIQVGTYRYIFTTT